MPAEDVLKRRFRMGRFICCICDFNTSLLNELMKCNGWKNDLSNWRHSAVSLQLPDSSWLAGPLSCKGSDPTTVQCCFQQFGTTVWGHVTTHSSAACISKFACDKILLQLMKWTSCLQIVQYNPSDCELDYWITIWTIGYISLFLSMGISMNSAQL